MGYELRAVVGRHVPASASALFAAAPLTVDPWTVALDQGFGLVPMVDEVLDALFAASIDGPVVEGFAYLTVGIVDALAGRGLELAYIEVDMFGGSGTQTAMGFGPGGMTTEPEHSTFGGFGPPPRDRQDWAVNAALRRLGAVVPPGGTDEFEEVGLRRHRHTEDWFADGERRERRTPS
jgi:hypothetical protein